jgi:hypothetical protein
VVLTAPLLTASAPTRRCRARTSPSAHHTSFIRDMSVGKG